MLSSMIRKRWPIPVALVVLVAGAVAVAIASSQDDGQTLVIYNGRSHYGDEGVFDDFEAETGIQVEVRGGSSGELFDRLEQEGEDTPADVLITTDLSNLWRADEAGLLKPVTSPALEANVPEVLREADGSWWALSTRMRVPVISTERVDLAEVTSYESLGDPQLKGRTCLRSSNNEYNQSLVADMLAKRGDVETRALLESWMANDPDIVGSDVDLLSAIEAGDCDVGLTNHYYLGRALEEDPDFPVAPAWPDQDGAGAHTNISGIGMITWTDQPDEVLRLMEHLTAPDADFITAGSELAANPKVPAPSHIADWAAVRQDPIAVDEAGPLLAEAVQLMLDVGWD